MTDPIDRLLSVSDAAAQLGVSYETIRRWIRKGALKAHVVGPHKIVRIPESAVLKLVDKYDHGQDRT